MRFVKNIILLSLIFISFNVFGVQGDAVKDGVAKDKVLIDNTLRSTKELSVRLDQDIVSTARKAEDSKAKKGLLDEGFLKVTGGLVFWTLVTFGILVFVLGKFGWKTIINALDTRINEIKNNLEQAETSKLDADKVLAEQKKLLQKARADSEAIISKAKAEAGETRDDIIEKARKDAQDLAEKAIQEIENAKSRAFEELKNEIGLISLDIAGKVIEKTLKPADHKELIEKALIHYNSNN